MSDQPYIALAQKSLELYRELDKTLHDLNASLPEKGPTIEKGALIRFFDDQFRGWNDRSNPHGSIVGLREVLALVDGDVGIIDPNPEPKKYYVLSDCEHPFRVFFDEATAKEEGAKYSNYFLDVFDEHGISICSWKCVTVEGSDQCTWTTNF